MSRYMNTACLVVLIFHSRLGLAAGLLFQV